MIIKIRPQRPVNLAAQIRPQPQLQKTARFPIQQTAQNPDAALGNSLARGIINLPAAGRAQAPAQIPTASRTNQPPQSRCRKNCRRGSRQRRRQAGHTAPTARAALQLRPPTQFSQQTQFKKLQQQILLTRFLQRGQQQQYRNRQNIQILLRLFRRQTQSNISAT